MKLFFSYSLTHLSGKSSLLPWLYKRSNCWFSAKHSLLKPTPPVFVSSRCQIFYYPICENTSCSSGRRKQESKTSGDADPSIFREIMMFVWFVYEDVRTTQSFHYSLDSVCLGCCEMFAKPNRAHSLTNSGLNFIIQFLFSVLLSFFPTPHVFRWD